MTKNEGLALRHYSTNYKVIRSKSSEEQKEIRRKLMQKDWLSEDEKVLNLLKNEIIPFQLRFTI